MPDASSPSEAVIALLASAEAALDAPNGDDATVAFGAVSRIEEFLRAIERATPGGAPLHAHLDTVRKWVAVLAEPGDHGRLGGGGRVRDHVAMRFRLARAAANDYFEATS